MNLHWHRLGMTAWSQLCRQGPETAPVSPSSSEGQHCPGLHEQEHPHRWPLHSAQHSLDHIWITTASFGAPVEERCWLWAKRAPRVVRAGALVLWGEAEGPALAQPGDKITLEGTKAPHCWQGGYQNTEPASSRRCMMGGRETKSVSWTTLIQTGYKKKLSPHGDSRAV